MIKACIFDLDGVIVDTARYHFLAWKRLANELGFGLTEVHNEKLKGVSRMDSLQIVLDLAGVSPDKQQKEKLADKKNQWFNEYIDRMLPAEIFPGVQQLIPQLKARGLQVAVASSSKNASRVIDRLQIQSQFDVIVDGTMITHSKPHPEIFLLTAHKLHVEPAHCVVFEDAEAGVEAAIAAGMKCIGIGSAERLYKADKVLTNTGDFKLSMLYELETLTNK